MLLENRFGLDHISMIQQFIEHGLRPTEVYDSLTKFGKITENNKEDILMSLYTISLKGRD